ncbi:DNA-processing protein DprA [Mycolicibacterium psychrotolerans]|uniref:Putative DNA processing protein DprA n=1 Tax=Mycolicibacterium psychrotolerans TaxID=216929 RepID=A0A7I7MFB3_9MYCO|nr:DNA-processing protein DprA [Mycolicibacterium psychrotolerans]BBX71004.1 putative DNA processing protein DprA [Mycolicibacterium psychrotolerans]
MTEEERRAWAYLSRVAEPPNPRVAALAATLGPVEAAERIRRRDLTDAPLLKGTAARHEIDCARDDLEVLDRLGGRLIVEGDGEWPYLAFRSFAGVEKFSKPQAYAPLALWVVGPSALSMVSERAAAIVGTRAATSYGEFATADLAAGLAERDVAIVSGGAYGIDGAAHRAALACDGVTVAVLACGIDVPYPSGHSALLHRVSRHGLIVSEYPPGMRPSRRQFLARNRLVAAVTGATVVVEAGVRSGAANTAAWARALGRNVCAVPGPITSASSVGCHALIRNEAHLVTRAEEILELVGRAGEIAEDPPRPRSELDDLSPDELAVYEALPGRGTRSIEDIAVVAGLPVADVLGPLTMLDIKGLVTQDNGDWKLLRPRVSTRR